MSTNRNSIHNKISTEGGSRTKQLLQLMRKSSRLELAEQDAGVTAPTSSLLASPQPPSSSSISKTLTTSSSSVTKTTASAPPLPIANTSHRSPEQSAKRSDTNSNRKSTKNNSCSDRLQIEANRIRSHAYRSDLNTTGLVWDGNAGLKPSKEKEIIIVKRKAKSRPLEPMDEVTFNEYLQNPLGLKETKGSQSIVSLWSMLDGLLGDIDVQQIAQKSFNVNLADDTKFISTTEGSASSSSRTTRRLRTNREMVWARMAY